MFLKLLPWIFLGFILLSGLGLIVWHTIIGPWFRGRIEHEREMERLKVQRDIALFGESTAVPVDTTVQEKEEHPS
jgi:hypothetical protein